MPHVVYAVFDAAGQPVALNAGESFSTHRLRVTDSSEVEAYGAEIGAQVEVECVHDWAQLDIFTPDDLAHYGIVRFEFADAPYGQAFAGTTLALDQAGAITAAAVYEARPLTALKAEKRAAAVAEYEARRQAPFSWDFAALETKDDLGASQGAAGLQTLQMREGLTPGGDDQKNWSTLMTAALAYEAASAGTTILPMKTKANVWVQTTAAQVLDVLLRGDGTQVSAVQRGMLMLQRVGALKADIEVAADAAALAAIDVTSGWPTL